MTGKIKPPFVHSTYEQKAEFRPVAIELGKNEASFHHPLFVHGSFENFSPRPRPRRSLVINVFRDGVKSDADTPLLEGRSGHRSRRENRRVFFSASFPK